MFFFHNVRRAQHDVFTGRAYQHTVVETGHEHVISALARRARDGGHFHCAGQPQAADADHRGQALDATVQCVAQHRAHLAGAFKQLVLLEQLQRGDGRRARHRVARIGVAVKKLDGVLGAAGTGGHHAVVNAVATNHAAQRNHTVGHALGEVQHVGHNAVIVGAEVGAHAAKAGDHLVKNQQNAVLVADLTKTLQVALRRQVPTGAAGHRLNDHGSNVAGIVQRQDAVFEFKQQVFLPDRLLVVDVGVVHRVVNETHMVHPRQQRRAVGLAVGRNAAHAHAAETHAVVAALAAYEHIAVAFAARAVVGQRHFERGVCRL